MELLGNAVVQITILIISCFLAYFVFSGTERSITTDTIAAEYDYIVVGGGSAGSIVATRLSENPGVEVLLLEAGGDDLDIPEIRVPAMCFGLNGRKDVDWLYTTKPQTRGSQAWLNKQTFWPRGKVLGGSASINAMFHVRGSPQDYNHWSHLGCDGWTYEDVLPYFNKLETTYVDGTTASPYRGHNGPIGVTKNPASYYGELFAKMAEEYGYESGDYNGKHCEGVFSPLQLSVHNGIRQSSAERYLRPAACTRTNLHIVTRAHVSRIIFEDIRAVGVKFMRHGTTQEVTAKQEVILSAGTVGSPHALLLSGIGPQEHLEDMGIPIVADLPVGEHLQDHIYFASQFAINQSNNDSFDLDSMWEKLKYRFVGTGAYASHIFSGLGHVLSSLQPEDHTFAYIQYLISSNMIGASKDGMNAFVKALNLDIDIFQEVYGTTEGQQGFTVYSMLQHPASTGHIRLISTNPLAYPSIDPRYLTEDIDLRILINATKHIRNMVMESATFAHLDPTLQDHLNPRCAHMLHSSDEYLGCNILHFASTTYHPTGTCRMGAVSDHRAVVDTRLRVKGVRGLRVVDASIFPEITTGNTNIPTMMVAEMAADMIKADNY